MVIIYGGTRHNVRAPNGEEWWYDEAALELEGAGGGGGGYPTAVYGGFAAQHPVECQAFTETCGYDVTLNRATGCQFVGPDGR